MRVETPFEPNLIVQECVHKKALISETEWVIGVKLGAKLVL